MASDLSTAIEKTSPVPFVGRAAAVGSSPQVRNLVPSAPWTEPLGIIEVANYEIREGSPTERSPFNGRPPRETPDPDAAAAPPIGAPSPSPLTSFDGINNFQNAQANGGFLFSPPDTVGDIGPLHYVQATNTTVRVFDKTGFPLSGLFEMSQLFSSLSASVCAARDDGDPIVTYDKYSDRWIISQFALPRVGTATVGPFHQCIAVSKTPDPTGAYHLFDFEMPSNKFNDYPHFGMWSHAYFMSIHQFNAGANRFAGSGVFAFDRTRLLTGDAAASFVFFDLESSDPDYFGMLPADADGSQLPAVGTPGIFVSFDADEFGAPADAVSIRELVVDFANPGAATFTALPSLPVAAFSPSSPTGRRDIPQPPPATATNNLDAISDRMMHRVQYRNFGTHESMVALHTVDADATAAFRFAPRYYELRRAPAGAGAWTVFDQGTFAPADTTHRWMGSVAMDRAGNVAFGYSVSSTTVNPGVRYAGHLAGNPSGVFEDEAVLVNGGGQQRTTSNRWGDYSSMNVDPVDECTFWYTQEYYTSPNPCASLSVAAQNVCWATRIGSFRFPSCAAEALPGVVQGRVTRTVGGQPVPNVAVTTGGFATSTDANGMYTLRVPAASYSFVASRAGIATSLSAPVNVTAGGAFTVNFSVTGAPALGLGAPLLTGTPVGSSNNGVVDIDECFTGTATMQNSGFGGATNVVATLSSPTPGVTITSPTLNFGSVDALSSNAPSNEVALRTEPTFVIGTPIQLDFAVTSDQISSSGASVVLTGSRDPAAQTFAATGPVAIDAVNPGVSQLDIPVSGITSAINEVTVAMHITHTWGNDLRVRLRAPDGTAIDLVDGRGPNDADNFGTDCPVDDGDDTIFDDDATQPIGFISSATPPGPPAPFVGTFRPEQPLRTFRGKSGAAVNGNWSLVVEDFFAGDGGAIQCVGLTINGHTTVSGTCSTPPTDPSATGSASPASVAITETAQLTVTVTPGTNPTSSGVDVLADLTSIGGSGGQAFVDDGATQGDVTAGDNIWSYQAQVAVGTAPGAKSFAVTVTDAQSRSAATTIALDVQTPGALAATGSANPVTVLRGATSTLSVTVTPGTTPASSGVEVRADLSSIGLSASQLFADPESDNVWTFDAAVPGNAAPGAKSLPVTVTDREARNASTNIALTVQAPTSPTGTGNANPSSVLAGGTTLLTVATTGGTSPTSTGIEVTANLAAIGGSTTQAFFDDGTNGDVTLGDGIFSFSATVTAGTTAGVKNLPATIADDEGRTGTASIALNVPAAGSPSGTGLAVPSQVQIGNTATLLVTVAPGTNPPSSGITVRADLTGINGSATQALRDDGLSGDQTAGDNVFTYVASVPMNATPGQKTMAVTINDAQIRTATSSISLRVIGGDALFGDGYENP